jgi:hypothetical protein
VGFEDYVIQTQTDKIEIYVLSIGQAVKIPNSISSSENVYQLFSYVITKTLGMAKRVFKITNISVLHKENFLM